jgi:thymidylate kinase
MMIVEFSGLPRSGKSTCLDAIKDYYTRQGYNVRLLMEGARTCPFPHRHRVKTAFWTANQVLNDIIHVSTLSSNDTLILQDRGLFDAMAFIKLLELEPVTFGEDANLLDNFAAHDGINAFLSSMTNWAKLVDLVILFETPPEVVLGRDLASKMNAGPGLITNSHTLRSLLTAYQSIKDEYGERFPKIVSVANRNGDALETAMTIKDLIDEKFSFSQKSSLVRS